jgi:uncharacterized protein
MVYKKYRVTGKKLLASFAIMFFIGFFLAFSILNIQNNKNENTVATQPITSTIVKEIIKETNMEGQGTKAQAKVAAVSPNGDGILGDVTVQVRPGTGELLVDISPFIEPDTQYSATTAVNVAKKITQTNLDDKDVIINFNVNGTVLGGPSAGAAMTIAAISAIEDKPIKNGVLITGTIEPDGTIGKVGGIIEKGDTAADNNYKTLLIPEGQSTFTYYERQITKREIRGVVFYNTKLTPKTVNLQEYFKDRGMNVIEVSNIQEAMRYML